MALIPQDRQSQYMLLITIAMVALGYFFWNYWVQPTNAKIAATRAEADSLQTVIDRAKQDLASGTVDDLRRKVEEYQALLSAMRRLVPQQNEVPALIDDISTNSKVRGVTIGRFEPLAVEPGQPFDTYRYRLEILGHYDELGELPSDIASLPRIEARQHARHATGIGRYRCHYRSRHRHVARARGLPLRGGRARAVPVAAQVGRHPAAPGGSEARGHLLRLALPGTERGGTA